MNNTRRCFARRFAALEIAQRGKGLHSMRIGFLVGALIATALGGVKAAEPADGGVSDFLLRPASQPHYGIPTASAAPQAKATTQESGLPVLSIHGWNKAQDRPSIQLALVLGKTADPAALAPLAIDGVKAVTDWKHAIEMLDQPIVGVPGQIRRKSMALLEFDDQKLLRLMGHDNSLKKPAVFGLDESGVRLVFYVLETWSDASGDFRLELRDLDAAADKFAQPGQLRIWLLDDEKPVWSETIPWPGKQEKVLAPKPAEPATPKFDMAPPRLSPGDGPLAPAAVAPTVPATNLPPLWPSNPVAPPRNSPPPQAVQPPAPLDVKEMSVDQLVDHIDKTWGAGMSSRVRREWQGGTDYFYKSQNPVADRLNVFVRVVKDCYWETSGELHDAFSVLYGKLKQRQTPSAHQ